MENRYIYSDFVPIGQNIYVPKEFTWYYGICVPKRYWTFSWPGWFWSEILKNNVSRLKHFRDPHIYMRAIPQEHFGPAKENFRLPALSFERESGDYINGQGVNLFVWRHTDPILLPSHFLRMTSRPLRLRGERRGSTWLPTDSLTSV